MKKIYKNALKGIKILSIFFIVFFAFSTLSCSSEKDYEFFSTINGTVTDYEAGTPLSNASILLSPGGITKMTDEHGCFCFEELEPQQYNLVIQKAGYQPNRRNVTAISGETVSVQITMNKIPQ